MNDLVLEALRKASEIRKRYKILPYQPLNILDLCYTMDITVRFVEINMEGMYFVRTDGSIPQILISNQRPLGRRSFTCAHELGHHLFEHGNKVDILTTGISKGYDRNEYLVDIFAGSLLMPVTAVLTEFVKRDWNINASTPEQFHLISSTFGTGYRTLISHCQKNGLIKEDFAKNLLKINPNKIWASIIGTNELKSHFKIFDELNSSKVVDLEVGNAIILPPSIRVEGNRLYKRENTSSGVVYIADKPGIDRIIGDGDNQNYFVRVQKLGYTGLAEYRHLEN